LQIVETMNELKHPADRSLPPPPMAPGNATEDDGAALRAVRAFLLDDDVVCALDSDEEEPRFAPLSGDSSFTNGSTTEALPRKVPVATKHPPARPRMVNRSRERMKKEIFSLRQKSIALEQRLAQIQRDGNASMSPTTTSTAGTLTLGTPWQTTALKQRELLEAAEQEREKLRRKVNECKQAIKRVHRFLQRQCTSVMVLPLGVSHQTASLLDAPIGYEELSEYLDSMYAQLDSVFRDEDLSSVTRVTGELDKVRIQNEDSFNMSFEFLRSRVLPFDVATTAKAVWVFLAAKAGGAQVQEGSQDTEDALRGSIVSTVSFPHFKGHVRGYWEARRFVDKDRIVVLHCSIHHRFEGAGEAIDGFGVRILNWTVISPPRDKNQRTASGRSLSHIDSFEVAMPFIAEGSTTRSFTPMQLEEQKKFLLRSAKCTHVHERQVIENVLLSGSK
jgi:hypothetical protein